VRLLHNAGGAGSQHDPFGVGRAGRRQDPAQPPVSRPTPFGQPGSDDRRRHEGAAGGSLARPLRGAVPRRAAGIRPRDAGGAAPTAGIGPRRGGARQRACRLPRPVSTDRGDEPLPLRYLDDAGLACSRAPRCAQDYQAKISGPLFDRIDLHVDVPAVSPADLSLPPPAEGSDAVAARVAIARARQTERYAAPGTGNEGPRTNAEADGEILEKAAAPDETGRALLTDAATRMRLTARGYHRVLRVARTLADLEGADAVKRVHIAEALSWRRVMPGR